MSTDSGGQLDLKAFEYIVNHVFLPPKLPSEDDSKKIHHEALLHAISSSLNQFLDHVSEQDKSVVRCATNTINNMQRVHSGSERSKHSSIDATALTEILHSWTDSTDEYVPLHVSAQNAALLISRTSNSIRFEAFELSPQNESVMATQGRLIRSFPASAVDLPLKETTLEFLIAMSEALAKLSFQDVPEAQVQIRKANSILNESRDATRPLMVTQFLVSWLLAQGNPAKDVTTVTKHTRDEALWLNCLIPWRRSPAWLLIRVTLHLLFTRRRVGKESPDLYKHSMLFLMSDLLDRLKNSSLESDLLFCMSAKINRRRLKLGQNLTIGKAHVLNVLDNTEKALRTRWSSICEQDNLKPDLISLKTLVFKNDVETPMPGLDAFIRSIGDRVHSPAVASTPKFKTIPKGVTPHQLPTALFDSDWSSEVPNSQFAFETWVADNLDTWLRTNLAAPETCHRIANLIIKYTSRSVAFSSGDPESMSIFFLTVMDLWVACDKAAIQAHALLADYDPGIAASDLQTLLLSRKSDMTRLQKIETHLTSRKAKATYSSPHIFTSFGTETSFSVRYFEQSDEHKKLKARIEGEATAARDKKRAEFQAQKMEYERLMRSYESTECGCPTRLQQGNRFQHAAQCETQRATDRSAAEKLEIMVYEWPLPSHELQAKSVVFELKVPVPFGFWREMTLSVRSAIFGQSQCNHTKVRWRHTLETFAGLKTYFQPFVRYVDKSTKNRIYLLSEDKPHTWTHRREDKIAKLTEEKVLLTNALRLSYFDDRAGCAFVDLKASSKVQKSTEFQLPPRSSMLQKFIHRSPSSPTGPSTNEAIASQHECPSHMTTLEFKALCSLPLGSRIVWQNILVQLHQPTIDFQKEETLIFVLHAILRAGVPHESSVLRETHLVLGDSTFTAPLLKGIESVLARYEKNWQAIHALSAMVMLLCRVCNVSPEKKVRMECLKSLRRCREIALDWLRLLEQDVQAVESDSMSRARRTKVATIALLCACSFDLVEVDFRTVLVDENEMVTFLQCSIMVKDLEQSLERKDALLTFMGSRWKRLLFRNYKIVLEHVVKNGNKSLEQAIRRFWPNCSQMEDCQSLSQEAEHWLTSKGIAGPGKVFTVHFNLWTGTLLVNGAALGRLPIAYEQHPLYKTVFGNLAIKVAASFLPGMSFASRTSVNGYSLHFGMTSKRSLLLRAIKDGRSYELLPLGLFESLVPRLFSEDYVHWLDVTDQRVEFRSKASPWCFEPDNWTLSRGSSTSCWQLTKLGTTLLATRSSSVKIIAKVLSAIEDANEIHCALQANGLLEIRCPRLQLSFFLEEGTDMMESCQHHGFYIDTSQSIGCLIGLQDRLVLKSIGRQSLRKVIIPKGEASFSKQNGHVCVTISRAGAARPHVYQLDPLLWKLNDDEKSMDSMLWLAFMHALTSSCVPDPLTGRTGTEESISILRSAAVRSFDKLSESSARILGYIAQVSPGQKYYPEHLKAMQVVSWSPHLPFMSQKSEFSTLVKGLFEKHGQWVSVFEPDCLLQIPNLPDVDSYLSRRYGIRCATFCISEFGAENFTTQYDKWHRDRDEWQKAFRIDHILAVVRLAKEGVLAPGYEFPSNLGDHIHDFIKKNTPKNLPGSLDKNHLQYDAQCLSGSQTFISQHWPAIHEFCTDLASNKHRYILWLAGLAFESNADMYIILTLASFMSNSQFVTSIDSMKREFHSHQLSALVQDEIYEIVSSNVVSFRSSAEAMHIPRRGTSAQLRSGNHETLFHTKQNDIIRLLVSHLSLQFPCWSFDPPPEKESREWNSYVNLTKVFSEVQSRFGSWFHSPRFTEYLDNINLGVNRNSVDFIQRNPNVLGGNDPKSSNKCFFTGRDIFNRPAPVVSLPTPESLPTIKSEQSSDAHIEISTIIEQLEEFASSEFEKTYVGKLQSSLQALRKQKHFVELDGHQDHLLPLLRTYQEANNQNIESIFNQIRVALGKQIMQGQLHGPRATPTFFLRNLNWSYWKVLNKDWQACLVTYGVALTRVQQAIRMLNGYDNKAKLYAELCNPGHTTWQPADNPESLLQEVEGDIMIREVQEQVAAQMRDPRSAKTETSQLNMGEGKSSTIIPMVVAHLTRQDRLVRVIVAKPQSKQMHSMLVTKLGGLLNRPVLSMPFSRSFKVTEESIRIVDQLFNACKTERGVLLVQPEHILSFKLMAIEQNINSTDEVGRAIMRLYQDLQQTTRDILDESDENLSVKLELIYTMGSQGLVDFSPMRWIAIQEVLTAIKLLAPEFKKQHPHEMELRVGHPGRFNFLRFLDGQLLEQFLREIIERLYSTAFCGLPIASWSSKFRAAVLRYTSVAELSTAEIDAVEKSEHWNDQSREPILLLRGLTSDGVLAFCLGSKRYRVDYGITSTREKPTRLAVPFRAKDSPSPRSEFSHPDVVLVLTSLSYYYAGLSDLELFDAFAHLCQSDQANAEYRLWIKDSDEISPAFHNLSGINLEDKAMCTEQIFPRLRYAKAVVDYFLSQLVFPKEMKEFSNKLTSSGWDLAELKQYATTGFSGTNDNPLVLLTVVQLDVEEQRHTNALVIKNVLHPDNTVAPPLESGIEEINNAIAILDMVISLDPPVRVILDVGAQIIELENFQVAQMWLSKLPMTRYNQAAVFFDENDDLCVVDREGRVQLLRESSYSKQLDVCIIFLDDSHTRGIDLQLPAQYRALVTLGPGLTKDRLVQACMRMRRLGNGQAVVFHAPGEVRARMLSKPPTAKSILLWTIQNLWDEVGRTCPLWASQGRSHSRQASLWHKSRADNEIRMPRDLAQRFLEKERQSIASRYQPKTAMAAQQALPLEHTRANKDPIAAKLRTYGRPHGPSTRLQEQQERELAPEIQQERQLQLPGSALAAKPSIHEDLRAFVTTGELAPTSRAIRLASQMLKSTSMARNLEIEFKNSKLRTTWDFCKTVVQTSDSVLDCYQRSVQWVLTSPQTGTVQKMIIVSPHEADGLLPAIRNSQFVSLHLYAPRTHKIYEPLDTLDLFTVPRALKATIPGNLIAELNLFAGQLYFSTRKDCLRMCDLLGLRLCLAGEEEHSVIASGSSEVSLPIARLFPKDPSNFVRWFFSNVRLNSSDISRTDMGHILEHKFPPDLS